MLQCWSLQNPVKLWKRQKEVKLHLFTNVLSSRGRQMVKTTVMTWSNGVDPSLCIIIWSRIVYWDFVTSSISLCGKSVAVNLLLLLSVNIYKPKASKWSQTLHNVRIFNSGVLDYDVANFIGFINMFSINSIDLPVWTPKTCFLTFILFLLLMNFALFGR